MKKKRNKESEFDYASFKSSALESLQAGEPLLGEGGILKDLIKDLVEGALDGEMDAHLSSEKISGKSNRRNGHTKKQLRTESGEISIQPPRDRQGSFTPMLVEKWERNLGSGLDHQVLELYSLGNSYEDIQTHLEQMYGVSLSKGQLSAITDRVWPKIVEWQKRALESLYLVVFLDAIHFKVREEGQVQTKAVYTVYGVDVEGNRDVLGLKVGQAEGAKEWGRILETLKDRGVEDVLFFAIDGLPGFKEAILDIFPHSTIQRCVVHMVRSSLRFVDEADAKAVAKALRAIYTAEDETAGKLALDAFDQAWGKKYPEIVAAWQNNWIELTAFFGFNWAVRKLIYTTNAVEGLHRLMRKTTKTKAAFVNDKALLKLLFLSLERKKKVWARKIHSYKAVQRSLIREFGQRIEKHLKI